MTWDNGTYEHGRWPSRVHRIKFKISPSRTEVYLEPGDFLILEGSANTGKTHALNEIYKEYSDICNYAWPQRENYRCERLDASPDYYQRQIIKGLIEPAEVYLLDEPTEHLNRQQKNELLFLLRKLTRQWNKIVIMATHETESKAFGTRRIELFEKKDFQERGPGAMNK